MKTQDTIHTPQIDKAYLIMFFVLSVALQFCAKILKTDIVTNLWVPAGAFILAFGICNSLYEKFKSFGLMTREDRNNFPGINSLIPLPIGVALMCNGHLMNLIVTVIVIAIIGGGRYVMDKKRCDKFNQNIGKRGVAETEITTNGTMKTAKDEFIKVTVKNGMIRKGSKVEIVGMLGYNLIVEKI